MASSILAMLATSSAYAKTEGDYLGVSLLQSRAKSRYNGSSSDTSIGYGIDYKHAFHFDNEVFLAPGIFYDRIGTSSNSISVRERVGVKLDLGYDFTHQFALYFTNGVASNRAKVNSHSDMSDLSYFYGIGALFHATRNVTLNVEYNNQHFDANGPASSHDASTRLQVMKVGIAYHF